MKSLIPFITVALLTGCNWMVRTETVEVKVPVPVPCVDREDVPAVVPGAEESVKKGSAPGEKIKAVLIERERLRQADTTFRALIQGCLL